jgi:hypothetical protein
LPQIIGSLIATHKINIALAGGDRVKHLSSGVFRWPVLK